MHFYIRIKVGYRIYRIRVYRRSINERTEQYCIIGKDRIVVIESNRPYFRNRGLKYRRPEWKVIEGKVQDNAGFKEVINAILEVVDK